MRSQSPWAGQRGLEHVSFAAVGFGDGIWQSLRALCETTSLSGISMLWTQDFLRHYDGVPLVGIRGIAAAIDDTETIGKVFEAFPTTAFQVNLNSWQSAAWWRHSSAPALPASPAMIRPWMPILSACGLAVLAAMGLLRVGWDGDAAGLLPRGQPEVVGLRLAREAFSKKEEIVLTLRGRDPAAVAAAARALAEFAAADPGIAALADAAALRERLAASGAAGLDARDRQVALALLAYGWFEAPPDEFAALAGRLVPGRAAAPAPGSAAADPFGLLALDWQRTARAALPAAEAENGRFRVLVARAAGGPFDAAGSLAWMEATRARLLDWAAAAPELRQVRLRLTGEPVALAEALGSTRRDLALSAASTLVLVALMFWGLTRSLRPLVWLVGVLAAVFALTLGAGGWLFRDLTALSAGFAAILLGLAVDYAAIVYQESLSQNGDPSELRRTAGRGVLGSALSTAAVFATLVASGVPGLRQLGALVAIGLVVAAVLMLAAYAPACARLRREHPAPPAPWRQLERSSWRRLAFTPLLVAGLAASLWLTGLPRINLDAHILQPRGSEALAARDEIEAAWRGPDSPGPGLLLAAPDPAALWARRAAAAERLEAARAAGQLAAWHLPGRNAAAIQDLLGREAGLVAALRAAASDSDAVILVQGVFRHWRRLLGEPGDNSALAGAGLDRLVSHRPGAHALAGRAIPADPKLFAARDFTWLEPLLGAGLHPASWETIGPALIRTLKDDFRRLAWPALVVLMAMLWFVLGGLRDVALALASLALGGLALLATMSLLGWQWNVVSLCAIPLLTGAGLDYTIHMILALRRSDGDLAVIRIGVRKALLFCALSSLAGFGSLTLAGNAGLAGLGAVCALGIIFTMVVSLFFLPRWWVFLCRRGKNPAAGADLRGTAAGGMVRP
jgi:uncharacterized protein